MATRRLAFCPDCYGVEPEGGNCACAEPDAIGAEDEDSGRFAAAVDAPRLGPPIDRARRLVPAMVFAGVLVVVALLAVIIS